MKHFWVFSLTVLLAATWSSADWPLAAQESPFKLLNELGSDRLGGLRRGEELTLSGQFKIEEGGRNGVLSVTAEIAPNWHVYSVNQKGGPGPSRINVKPDQGVELSGAFQPDRDPSVRMITDDKGVPIFEVPVQEHHDRVTWTAPIRLEEQVEPQQLKLQLTFNGQVCNDASSCIPIINKPVAAQFAGYYEPAAATGQYRAKNSHATIRGQIEPQVVKPGSVAKLVLTAIPDTDYHVYAYAAKDPKAVGRGKPTLIVLSRTSGLTAKPPQASQAPLAKKLLPDEPEDHFYEEPVSWTIELQVPSEMPLGEYSVAGAIAYQTCRDAACDMPLAAEFQTTIQVASEAVAGQLPLSFSDASYGQVAELAETKASQTSDQPQLRQAIDPGTLALTILASLIGGLLLNLMPCVLPVIGLKVLAFAEQAGQKQAHVLMLNFWYSTGLISVFMVLATLAAFLNLGWGEQFTLTWFKVAMTALVFVMALSFLGVWEIPIPGFVGAGKSSKLQTQEGVAGAFFKGVFTTILATPCSGPFLGSAFGYTLSQPPIVTYVIFGSVGLGMASPYLLIGVFPGLIRFLPRPGAWMETFKQLLAFLLLATVVYLFSTLNATYFIPTLTLLVGLWFACWWIGRIPITAEANQKVRHWAGAAASAALVGIFAFKLLVPSDSDLPWKPYSPQTLAQLRAEGKTVLIDFTADWCPNCKWNLRTAINTQRVGKLVDQNNVVPLIADWTDRSPDIKEKLAELESNSIPLLAIYPAGQSDDEVIVLRDLLTESQVIEALKQAGPSQPAASATSTAMTRPAVERLPD